MKKIFYLPLIVWCYYFTANAQSCLSGENIFTTQAEIDSFKTNYPGCTKLGGSLTISGDQINNLNGLNEITVVNQLSIENTYNLLSLEGLESLREASIFTISNNSGLQNLNGLNATTVGYYLGLLNG